MTFNCALQVTGSSVHIVDSCNRGTLVTEITRTWLITARTNVNSVDPRDPYRRGRYVLH